MDANIKAGEPPVPLLSTEQPIAYQPVSGWAVAGCAVGGVFALLVAICTIVALSQGAPLFFPIWILGLAIVGVILSLIGQRHVQNSEGTRAGAKLAKVGFWLSLASGLCYFAYFYITGLALENQANTFVMEKTDDDSGFFPRLREAADNPAQLNAAFLLTRPANARGNANPEDEQGMRANFDVPKGDGTPGELTQFREHPFVRILFKESAKDAEITPLTVQEWHYEQRMYKIVRNYRIKTKEVDYEFRVSVFSSEAESAGQGRKWFVNLREVGYVARNLTEFGQGLGRLRPQARAKLNEWAFKPSQGAFKDIAAKDQTAWDRLVREDAQGKDRRARSISFVPARIGCRSSRWRAAMTTWAAGKRSMARSASISAFVSYCPASPEVRRRIPWMATPCSSRYRLSIRSISATSHVLLNGTLSAWSSRRSRRLRKRSFRKPRAEPEIRISGFPPRPVTQ